MKWGYLTYAILCLLWTTGYAYEKRPGTESYQSCLLKRSVPGKCLSENLALAERLVAQQQLTLAAQIYRCYVTKHPQQKMSVLRYAELERRVQNFCQGLEILNTYSHLFGKDEAYLKIKARIDAEAGYSLRALLINSPLRVKHPKDDYLIATQAIALYQSARPGSALSELNELQKIAPNSDELATLDTAIRQPLQDNGSLGKRYTDLNYTDIPTYIPSGPQFIHQNDTVTIYRAPVAIGLVLLSFLTISLAYRLGGELSTVFSLSTASIVIIYPLAAYFFDEHITIFHWIGLFILLCGSILLIFESY